MEDAVRLVHPDDRTESARESEKVWRLDGFLPREHRLIMDNQVIYVESAVLKYQGEIHHFGMFRDITDRKRAEEELRESEEQHRQIVESSTDAILVRSGDVIIYANPAAVSLFRACHTGEIVGKSYLGL